MTTRLRQSVLDARQKLAEGRATIRELHDRGAEGTKICARIASLFDTVLLELYEAAVADLNQPDADEICRRLTLVAHGGYGRRHMAPYSDIDLMVLYDGTESALIRDFSQRMMRDIFDSGEQVGHSVRPVGDAVQMARQDPQIGSSLLESRHLAGSQALYEKFSTSFTRMIQRRPNAQCRDFIHARQEERNQFGETVYLLEPNVKRSKGGLRDLHLLRWLWFVKCGVAEPDRLHAMGIVSKFDYRRLVSARNLLLRVRNDMHFHAGASYDAVTRVEQIRLANQFDYRGKPGLHPAEQFMRDYFQATGHIWRLAHRVSELVQPPSRVSRVFEPVFGRSKQDDYRIGIREISATNNAENRLETKVKEVLHLVDLARNYDKWISQDTWYLVYRAAPNFPQEQEPETLAYFLKLLGNPLQLGDFLRRLRDLGVLEKCIPEFAHARYLLQLNAYHHYTVDEHSIRAVEEVTRLGNRFAQLGDIYRDEPRKDLLHLALLLHDLGKGYEEDHSEVGSRIAESTAERFSLSAEDSELLVFLVHKHLEMAHIALRHDINKDEVVRNFANQVGSVDRLKLLYLLTCADLAAVGPDVLTDWKAGLIQQLYERSLQMLEPDAAAAVDDLREQIKHKVFKRLTFRERDNPWFPRQFNALPESYVRSRTVEEILEILRRFKDLPHRGGRAWGKYDPKTATIEFTTGVDQGTGRGIFSSMAAVFTAKGLEILAAESATLADSLLMQRYIVSDRDFPGEPTPVRLEKISEALVESIDNDQPPKPRSVWCNTAEGSGVAVGHLPQEVRIDNQLSDECIIVEVFTIDRPGLLYELARAAHDLELIIKFAKIGTYLDQVVDVFYLTERDGRKPYQASRLELIQQTFMEIINRDHVDNS